MSVCRTSALRDDAIHVDKVVSERAQVDLCPVGGRVGVENGAYLRQGRKGILTDFRRNLFG